MAWGPEWRRMARPSGGGRMASAPREYQMAWGPGRRWTVWAPGRRHQVMAWHRAATDPKALLPSPLSSSVLVETPREWSVEEEA